MSILNQNSEHLQSNLNDLLWGRLLMSPNYPRWYKYQPFFMVLNLHQMAGNHKLRLTQNKDLIAWVSQCRISHIF